MTPGKPTGRALIASFAAVAFTFTLGIAVAQTFSVRIRQAAREITGNSAPSLSVHASMRASVRALEVRLDDWVDGCQRGGCREAPARIDALHRELRADWAAYRRLPSFAGEAERWPQVDDGLHALDRGLDLTVAALARDRWSEAEELLAGEVKPACDRLDAAIASLTDFDRAQELAVATRIDTLARRSLVASVLLDVASVGLTILAAWLVLRVSRRYAQSLHDRAQELDQFAGRVAHDVLSPLASTSAALHVARRETTGRLRTAIEQGERGVQRVQRLVDGLLDFARAGAAHARGASADLDDVVEDVVTGLRDLAEGHRVELRAATAACGPVACTPGVLTSIVSNLVRNAITHMGPSEVREVWVRAQPAAGAVRVEVQDTGPGIPAALGERVFEPFVRGPTEQPGSGLGLATAKRFVEAHGGRIGFLARPGGGTLFWFELPATPDPARDDPRAHHG